MLANLIAAAVIYLLGVAVGLLPNKHEAVVTAVAVVLCGASLSVPVLNAALEGRIPDWWMPTLSFGLAVALTLVVHLGRTPTWLNAAYVVLSVPVLLFVLRRIRRRRRGQ